ncbi:hypothetical protein MKEN_00082600 [Mycena kentingensis (nom. inval.)]|nr:hypothetical protein MKEN_00082600 [Mycena kentingensis (nom. inval.)]
MVFTAFFAAFVLAAAAKSVPPKTDPLKTISIAAPDGSLKADFIAFGATNTNLWVKDKHGVFRDILLGYDNKTLYATSEEGRNFFSPIVGRYANRIRNGTFTIPISKDAQGPGRKFQIVENEHNGTNTLHGGAIGYDLRRWSVQNVNKHGVTFKLVDPDGFQGFPGTVVATVEYKLEANAEVKISMKANSDQLTPIMLSVHNYFNFDAYSAPANDLTNHFMRIASDAFVATDGNLIPTGELTPVEGTPLDFRKAKSIGDAIPATAEAQYCGKDKSVFSVWSTTSGIKLDVRTDQIALQIYSCNGILGANPIPRKANQGGPEAVYENHSCLVIEQESIIDAINNPEFNVNQIYGHGREYTWEATYAYSVIE